MGGINNAPLLMDLFPEERILARTCGGSKLVEMYRM